MTATESRPTRTVRGQLDRQRMAADFGVPATVIAGVFGIKTDFQRKIDAMGLDELREVDRLYLDEYDRHYLEMRTAGLIEEKMREHMSSLSALHHAAHQFHLWGLNASLALSLMEKLELEIVLNPTLPPWHWNDAVENLRHITSDETRAELRILIDASIKDALKNPAELQQLVRMHFFATDEKLKNKAWSQAMRQIDTAKTAANAVRWAEEAGVRPDANPFKLILGQMTQNELSQAKTANQKEAILASVWTELLLPDRIVLAEQVFDAYLKEDHLDSALRHLDRIAPEQSRDVLLRETRVAWQKKYAIAYDRLYLAEVEGTNDIEVLRAIKHERLVPYSGRFLTALKKIQAHLSDLITAAGSDLDRLTSLLDWPEINAEQREMIRKARAPGLESRFVAAMTQEDIKAFWALLDGNERETWMEQVLKKAVPFYITEKDFVEVEVSV